MLVNSGKDVNYKARSVWAECFSPHHNIDLSACKINCFNFIQKESESITQINSQEYYSENE